MENNFEEPVWVLGTKIPGVKCIDWISGDIPNFADCGTVIIDTRSLTDTIRTLMPIKRLQELSGQIKIRFIAGGNIICILEERMSSQNNEHHTIENYFWSPINFAPQKVNTGETFVPDPKFGFEDYLKEIKSWDVQIQQHNVSGIAPRQGESLQVNIHQTISTADDGLIGGVFTVNSLMRNSGKFVALPKILKPEDAIKTILEVLGIYETTPPPNWFETIKVPRVDELQNQLKPKLDQIDQLKKDVQNDIAEIESLEKFKKLLYATDKELEGIVKDSLDLIGLLNVRDGRSPEKEDLLFNFNSTDFDLGVVEVKGVKNSIELKDLRQSDEWVWDYKNKGNKAKGIVIANCYRFEDPSSSSQKRMEFNNLEYCKQHEISILPTWTLFQIVVNKLKESQLNVPKIENIFATKNDVITIDDLI